MTLRLLAVHAHPDDESSKGAATLAYYRSRGAEVMVVSCTGRRRGPGAQRAARAGPSSRAERDLPGLRRIEMAQRRRGHGHRRTAGSATRTPGWPEDGEPEPVNSFASIPLEISAEPLVRVIREFRPQVLITYDENGGYPHPDHIRTHEISIYARDAAADPDALSGCRPGLADPEDLLRPHLQRSADHAIYDALVARDPDSELVKQMDEMRRWFDRPDLATTHIPVGDFLEIRDRALLSHASQVVAGQHVLPVAQRPAARGLADRGLPARRLRSVRARPSRERPVRRRNRGLGPHVASCTDCASSPRRPRRPTPFPDYTGNPNLITPGVWGFIAILAVAVATVFLILDMTRRIRRSRYREEVRDQARGGAGRGRCRSGRRRAQGQPRQAQTDSRLRRAWR